MTLIFKMNSVLMISKSPSILPIFEMGRYKFVTNASEFVTPFFIFSRFIITSHSVGLSH